MQWSKRLEGETGQARIQQILTGLRTNPFSQLCEEPVQTFTDLGLGQSWVDGEEVQAPDLPASNVLIFKTSQHTRLIVRPSGTEPKIKFYLEKLGQPESEGDVVGLQAQLKREMDGFKQDLERDLGL
ncbi:MAG: hypothetical protein CMH56_11105 [Myxococcales bacterium]|nr:hypothetical protein [Myxococcales bacterium]